MKKLILLLIVVTAVSCSEDKRIVEREDIIGEWKEIQRRNTKKIPVYDILDCDDKNANGELYTFNADSTYTVRGICPGVEPEVKGEWIYRDNIISLMKGEYNYKFSVVYEGNNKIKFAVVSVEKNGLSNVDFFQLGTYSIFEKQ